LLFVEDDQAIVRSVVPALTACGVDVGQAASCSTAIAAYRSTEWDIVLLDLGLPDCSGVEFVRHVRAGGGNLPILVTSASQSQAEIDTALAEGGNGFLPKPFEIGVLLKRLRSLITEPIGGLPS
jgi:DNA-binding response OmpR family regulator